MVNNIIYVDPETWYWMRELKASIADAKARDAKKFKTMIDCHTNSFNYELKKVVSR